MNSTMRTAMPGLSKSRILSGLQCERRLWLETFRREAIETTPDIQAKLDEGNELGELARRLYGPGLLIGTPGDPAMAVRDTVAVLAAQRKRQTLYEAAFRHDGVLVRADILKPAAGGYDLIEVKSAGSVKDYHLVDCAVQAWVISHTGLKLRRIRLAHVDTSFVYPGDGDYDGLLVAEDVTEAVRALMASVPGWVNKLKGVLRRDEPSIATGEQCFKPFACPFHEYCRSKEPAGPSFPVTILWRGGALIRTLQDEGFDDLLKVPAARLTKPIHQRIHRASRTGRPILDPAASEIIETLAYPRYYIDFETIAFAIPRWAGTSPYRQLPFQWSCHVETKEGRLDEHAFLDLTGHPPMRGFAESLLKSVGRRGPIIVYNQAFERARLRELATLFPDLGDALLGLVERMVDLLPIAREHYYHPAMMGSWSIKAVLPTIAPDLDYDNLEDVADGGEAQLAYLEAVHPDTTVQRRQALETALRRYCGRDTLAMVRVAHALAGRRAGKRS